jgi:dTDP-4-dehydrorhamnose reductase
MATRILVTGAKGLLGTELMARLDPSHHDVVGVDLDNGDATLDITRRDLTVAAICEYEPDVIIHGAAFTAVDACESQPDTAYLVNSLATRFIAEGARRVGSHVVYVSTDYVFDGTKDGPYVEWDAPSPRSVYGRSKLGGEHELDPGWTIARTSWVCSAHGNNMVKTVLRVAAERDELSFVDDQYGHPTFAGDLAEMLIRLGVERAPGIHHVTNQGAVSWFGFVQAVMSAAGHDPERVKPISTAEFAASRPAEAPPMAPRPTNSVLDNFALRASGFGELRDFHEPLAEVVSALQ